MKLVNPKAPNAKLALGKDVVEADANGVVDVPDNYVDVLKRSGYMSVADWDKAREAQKRAPKPDVSPVAAEALRAKAAMSAPKVEAPKKAEETANAIKEEPKKAMDAQEPELEEEVIEEAEQPEVVEAEVQEVAEKPKRGWKRGGK